VTIVKALPPASESFDPAEFRLLMTAVDKTKPAQSDIAALHRYLSEHPEIAAYCGDVGVTIQDRILGKIYGDSPTREVVKAHVEQLRASLGYTESSGLERMVIEAVILCWVRWQDCEWRYQSHIEGQHSLASGDYWERRLTLAQKRHLKAIETLARVRRLLRKSPPAPSPAFNLLLKQQLLAQIKEPTNR